MSTFATLVTNVRRQWTLPRAAAESGGRLFKVMTYNILADSLALTHRNDLYRSIDWKFIKWANRWNLIREEISTIKPDIICFQEVDRFNDIYSSLSQEGYDGRYLQRGGDCQDGCSTFWRRDLFEFVETSTINFSESKLLRNNVALLCVLRLLPLNPQHKSFVVTVANTHLLFNPRRGDIKLAQAKIICEEVAASINKRRENCLPSVCILAGDFNSTPLSGVYNFILNGSIDLLKHSCKSVSSSQPESDALPESHEQSIDVSVTERAAVEPRRQWWPSSILDCSEFAQALPVQTFRETQSVPYEINWGSRVQANNIRLKAYRQLLSQFPSLAGWNMDQVEIAMGGNLPEIERWVRREKRANPFVLDHPLVLNSAYKTATGQEPLFTTKHDCCDQSVDFIFYTSCVNDDTFRGQPYVTLEPTRVLELPDSQIKMPNKDNGSDHIPLCTEFCIRFHRSYKEAGLLLPLPTTEINKDKQIVIRISKPSKRNPRRKRQKSKAKPAQLSVPRVNANRGLT